MTDAPERIWAGTAYGEDSGVDWSTRKVFRTDVEYVRADLHAAELAKAYAEGLEDAANVGGVNTATGRLDTKSERAARIRALPNKYEVK